MNKIYLTIPILLIVVLLIGCVPCTDGWRDNHYIPKNSTIEIQKDALRIQRIKNDEEKGITDFEYVKFPVSKMNITAEELKNITGEYIDSHTIPADIRENSVAQSSENCMGWMKYSIRKGSDFKGTTKWGFDRFIKKYNQDCNDCLILISNGCC